MQALCPMLTMNSSYKFMMCFRQSKIHSQVGHMVFAMAPASRVQGKSTSNLATVSGVVLLVSSHQA